MNFKFSTWIDLIKNSCQNGGIIDKLNIKIRFFEYLDITYSTKLYHSTMK